MQLVWTPAAREDLRGIRAYVAQHDPGAAKRVGVRVRRTARRLLAMPRSGPPGPLPGTRQIVVTGTPYLMPYRIEADRVVVLRVLHGRRLWPSTGT
jgi:toxin ParE1/3/4